MEKWRIERVKSILRDYNDTDKYVRKLEESIRVPHKETDVNGEIKGTKTENDIMFPTLWEIETNEAISRFKKQKRIVDDLLAECGVDTETIIRELYIRRFPQYTMQGLVENKKVFSSVRQSFRYRDKFFEEVDRQLDMA